MDPALRVRRLVRRCHTGVIATQSHDMPGFPYASFVEYVADHQGRPVMLISALAEHTRNLHYHARLSLAAALSPEEHVMASPRFTCLGEARLVPDEEIPACRARYLRYFPQAADYLSLDFAFWRIEPVRLRSIPGFGAAVWVTAGDYLALATRLAEVEADILDHMNSQHRDALVHYARQAGVEAAEVSMVGIDCDGFDLRIGTGLLRLDFAQPVWDVEGVREALRQLAQSGRTPG
jgi:putative heme iron utilization protein